MANQRHPSQALVAFGLDRQLLLALDTARQKPGWDRSKYIRQAVIEKLHQEGIAVPAELRDAPTRAGKPHTEKPASYKPSKKRKSE